MNKILMYLKVEVIYDELFHFYILIAIDDKNN